MTTPHTSWVDMLYGRVSLPLAAGANVGGALEEVPSEGQSGALSDEEALREHIEYERWSDIDEMATKAEED